ncbi:MAG: histidinol dehydrogenase [Oscillospiraceae bacterium]|nr:histidinol dehydrogenase [Oscillospiraceae bacterium]
MIRIIKADEFEKVSIVNKTISSTSLTSAVAMIIANIIKRGDEALREYTEKFDGCVLNQFELSEDAMDRAIENLDPEFINIMKRAAKNIEDFHRNQIQKGFEISPQDGIVLGQKITPIKRVGVYVPGGSASYPSSVLMNCIPAKIAGVKEIIIVTPPKRKCSSNCINDVCSIDGITCINGVDARVIAAAKIAGADRVFTIGGAQAIAALAFGTDTVPRVDKITGPGNAYVAEAKRQVFGIVGIDMIAGPSDILLIADSDANPAHIAADMLSQCEHGPDSPAILVTNCEILADKVRYEIELQVSELPRENIARKAVDNHGLIILTNSIEESFHISNAIAPEHLEILLDEPFTYLDKVVNAGSVFLGRFTPEAIADYYAGPNHTLPTSGTSRFSGPLSVEDFMKKTSYTYYSEEALKAASKDVVRFADEEGLRGHALSVIKRIYM